MRKKILIPSIAGLLIAAVLSWTFWPVTQPEYSSEIFGAGSTVEILVVAGGGGGGRIGGGGGAGGVIYNATYTPTSGLECTVTIGAGGTGAPELNTKGSNGSNSVLCDQTAIGGGGGGSLSTSAGVDGGSGGGGFQSGTPGNGTAGQGNAGANSGDTNEAGGGGGAGEAGDTDGDNLGGDGIADASIGGLLAMTTSGVGGFIAGGGSGANQVSDPAGGDGGGGQSRAWSGQSGIGGVANSGGGQGGAGNVNNSGASGGSGLVVVVYLTAQFTHESTGAGDSTGTSGSETWVKFTADGTLTLTSLGGGEGSPNRAVIIISQLQFKAENLVTA